MAITTRTDRRRARKALALRHIRIGRSRPRCPHCPLLIRRQMLPSHMQQWHPREWAGEERRRAVAREYREQMRQVREGVSALADLERVRYLFSPRVDDPIDRVLSGLGIVPDIRKEAQA